MCCFCNTVKFRGVGNPCHQGYTINKAQPKKLRNN